MLRYLFAAILCSITTSAAAAEGIFGFAPPDGTRFVRTLTRTGRIEFGGMVRTETTVLKAAFVFRQVTSGYRLVMTPLSFRYVVNDHDVESPVWELIRKRKLQMHFNSVGKLTEMQGFEEVDEELARRRVDFSADSPAMYLDRFPIGEEERANWNERILLWMSQPSRPGTHLEFDSSERGFTRERVRSHTTMQVVRTKKCGTRRCVVTHYTMVPDLTPMRQRANEHANVDLIDTTASEELEQTIEPDTMLPHYERLAWKSRIATAASEENSRSHEASLVVTSEFEYSGNR
ncbi:MAG TPA: hypothetical protein VJ276_18410 [Thermoanaerobaculia bacterium]|nr:hypothetical protein [Thermoanaerobaculia bacterium]